MLYGPAQLCLQQQHSQHLLTSLTHAQLLLPPILDVSKSQWLLKKEIFIFIQNAAFTSNAFSFSLCFFFSLLYSVLSIPFSYQPDTLAVHSDVFTTFILCWKLMFQVVLEMKCGLLQTLWVEPGLLLGLMFSSCFPANTSLLYVLQIFPICCI